MGRPPRSPTTVDVPPPGAITSPEHPIRVDWIDPAAVPPAARWTGRSGMTILPGKHGPGLSGYHWRDLELDVARLATFYGTQTLAVLVEDAELAATGTTAITTVVPAHGIELLRFPIVDESVPGDPVAYGAFLERLIERLRAGRRLVICCRGGLGRTGLTTACLLREAGLDPAAAMLVTRATRRGTIETAAQEAFVEAWPPG